MKFETIEPNECELSDIKSAQEEIDQICKKYNVALIGLYDGSNDYDDYWECVTDRTDIISKTYTDRKERYEEAYNLWQKLQREEEAKDFAIKMMGENPNHRNLVLYEQEWDEPSFFGHKPYRHTSLFVRGLKIKNRSLIKSPLFSWNSNGFWMYKKGDASYGVSADVSIWIYQKADTITVFSHPGNISGGVYSDFGNRYSIKSQAFVVQMVDELIDLGVLELVE